MDKLCRWFVFGIVRREGIQDTDWQGSLSPTCLDCRFGKISPLSSSASFSSFVSVPTNLHLFSNKEFHGLSRDEMSAWLKQSMKLSRATQILAHTLKKRLYYSADGCPCAYHPLVALQLCNSNMCVCGHRMRTTS